SPSRASSSVDATRSVNSSVTIIDPRSPTATVCFGGCHPGEDGIDVHVRRTGCRNGTRWRGFDAPAGHRVARPVALDRYLRPSIPPRARPVAPHGEAAG